jgi:hypothetical protein
MDVFFACFADLEDPRDDNARHDLLELLVIALCAVLCGAEDCSDMALFGRAKEAFFREVLTLRHGVPSHDTFSRVFRLIDPVKFHACFLVFMRKFSETIQGGYRHRWQDAAALLRPRLPKIGPSSRQRVGRGSAACAWPVRRGRQIQ